MLLMQSKISNKTFISHNMLVFKTMEIDGNQKIQFSDVNIELQKISENLSFGKNRLSFSQFCLSFGQILSFGIAQFWDKCRKNKPGLWSNFLGLNLLTTLSIFLPHIVHGISVV